jgi:hypothetical protein
MTELGDASLQGRPLYANASIMGRMGVIPIPPAMNR